MNDVQANFDGATYHKLSRLSSSHGVGEKGDDDSWGYITKHVRELYFFYRLGVGVSKSMAYLPYRTSSMQSKLSSR